MPKPTFEPTTGWWSIRINSAGGRRRIPLGKHPGWSKGQRPPRRAPDDIEQMAREHQLRAIRARQGLEAGPAAPMALAEFHRKHREAWVPGKRPLSVASFDRAWKKLLDFCAAEGVATVQAVGTGVCRSFLASRRAVASHNTVSQERGLIAPAWEAAVRDGAVPSNPWRLERVQGKPRAERPDYWELDELDRLLAACDPWSRDIATVGVNTGLRVENLVRLERSEVRLAERRLAIPAQKMKGGRPLTLPLNDAALEVLARHMARDRGQYVFRKPDGSEGPPNADNLTTRLVSARKRAKLPRKKNPCHILRHSFATHAAKTVPIPVLQQWLGHASIVQTMRYVQVSEAESARHMETFSLGISPVSRSASYDPASGPS